MASFPIVFTRQHVDAQLPQRHLQGAGYDIKSIEQVTIPPKSAIAIDTGLKIEIPPERMMIVRSRSGLALENHVAARQDVHYPSETKSLQIIMINYGENEYTVEAGHRIAQLIFHPYIRPRTRVVGLL